jgi:hypothetical protein
VPFRDACLPTAAHNAMIDVNGDSMANIPEFSIVTYERNRELPRALLNFVKRSLL